MNKEILNYSQESFLTEIDTPTTKFKPLKRREYLVIRIAKFLEKKRRQNISKKDERKFIIELLKRYPDHLYLISVFFDKAERTIRRWL